MATRAKADAVSSTGSSFASPLWPLLLVGVTVWALQTLEIPVDVAETTLICEGLKPQSRIDELPFRIGGVGWSSGGRVREQMMSLMECHAGISGAHVPD